jgi:hypothetical protein
MVKPEAENDMEAEFLMTSNGGLSLCGDEELSRSLSKKELSW